MENKENGNQINIKMSLVRFLLVVFGVMCYSIGLKWFVYPANVLPGGFTGLSVLCQRLVNTYTGVLIPLTVYNVLWNIVPAIMSYKLVGKRFTIISFIIMFLFTFVADAIPAVELSNDPLIYAIFGAILCGFGASLWFRCGISGGGTDFIALSVASKYHIQTFGYVMAFNILLIIIQGMMYGWNSAFYSIIYQYVCTQTINFGYKHYEKRTILIITTRPDEVSSALISQSSHSSTKFDGIGSFTKQAKSMLYTVVTQPEVRQVIQIIKKCDPEAFVNVINSNEIQGNFTYRSVEQGDIDFLGFSS